MLKEVYNKITRNEDLKESVLELKTLIKEDAKSDTHNKEAFMYMLAGDYSVLISLLKADDAKVRKNAAIILGELGENEFLMPLFEAYKKEEMRFVRSSYLEAVQKLDFRPVAEDIKLHIKQLSETEINEENKKHIGEELRILNKLNEMLEGTNKHTYTEKKLKKPVTAVLLTNRNHIHITSEKLNGLSFKEFNAGVMVYTDKPSRLYKIRTINEMLFMCDNIKNIPYDEDMAASSIANGELVRFLELMHIEKAPFNFRLELKSKAESDKRIKFIKRVSADIAIKSKGSLINSTDNYEVEIRLIENKKGSLNVLIKLFTLEDKRFEYRKEAIAASIKPVNAALCAELASPYLIKDAQVLDPFCGTGAMIIERHKVKPARNIYALDIFKKAIDGAKKNAEAAGVTINFINRDFFDFKHNYLFDEIFTNMPFSRENEDTSIERIYKNFFIKAVKHLTQEGIIIMHSHDRQLVKKMLPNSEFKIIKEFEISMKEGTYLYILGLKNI